MRRVAVAAAVVAAMAWTARGSAARDRPNYIVILVDDLRWDGLGFMGHPFVQTPNIDRLALEGMSFDNAFVTTPLCSPARASFLTGRYARAHGIRVNNDPRNVNETMETFPARLQAAGYDTAFIGKWHMGSGDGSPRPGFTHWISFEGQGRYSNPELDINGRRRLESGHLTDVLVGYADDFVRTAARGSRPFLLYLSHKAVHEPGDPPRRHRGTYNGARVPCSPGCEDTLEGKPALTREVPGTTTPRPGGGPPDANIRGRHRRLLAVDDGVGRLLRTLREEGVLDSTLVVFTSDNGYFHREHAIGDKRWAYEEALRVPFIVRYPRAVRRRSRESRLVLNVDLAPTLLDLAGVEVPESYHGRSLGPLLRGEPDARWRGEFVAEYFPEIGNRAPRWEAIRTARWKYVTYPDLGAEFDELYDLQTDRYELRNVVGAREHRELLESLRRRMAARFEALAP